MSRLVSHSNGRVSVSVPLGVPVVTTINSSWCPSVPVVFVLTAIHFIDTVTLSNLTPTRAQNNLCSMNS